MAGFAVAEMLLSIAVCLVLIAGSAWLALEIRLAQVALEASAQQLETARLAITRLTDEIGMAGYLGDYLAIPTAGQPGFPGSTPANPCTTELAALADDMPVFLQGYDGADAGARPDCIAAGDHLEGTDILVVRRASYEAITMGNMAPNTVYLQAGTRAIALGTATVPASLSLTRKDAGQPDAVPLDLHRYLVRMFFISPCTEPASGTTCSGPDDDGGRPRPALKMLELAAGGDGPVFRKTTLIRDVEQLQFDYGIDADGDGAPDRYSGCGTPTRCEADDWGNVVSVRVHVLARNPVPQPDHLNRNAYPLGRHGLAGPFNDGFRRHVGSAVARVNNNSMRRER